MLTKLVIISGLSGSGKSTALNAFEDLDYYAVDNLPIMLFEKFFEVIHAGSGEFSKVALVMDLRDASFVDHYPVVFRRVLQNATNVDILFLDSSDEVLTRRFSETRRKHPLSSKSVAEGIERERKLLGELKDMSTVLIDTSAMDVHALKRRVTEQFGPQNASSQMQIRVISFGFKYGMPKNCDLVFDVRFLSNPHFVAELRSQSGLDEGVQTYIKSDQRFEDFIHRTADYLAALIPHYAKEGKSYLTIGVGCTGGKHRSVYSVERLSERLKEVIDADFQVSTEHQDLRLT
jgi:UPF0042 nucleotide-binding protein